MSDLNLNTPETPEERNASAGDSGAARDAGAGARDAGSEVHAAGGRPVRRHRLRRVLLWFLGSAFVLLFVLALGLSWYTKTADFQRRVGGQVVSILEDATGGKVDLGHISFDLWHLAIEVDGLVIHGTEPAGEMPYLSAAKIFVRIKINTFLSHTVGRGAQSHVGLRYLRVEQPHVHLIIDKDGKTNQPVPKKPSTSSEPVQNTLLDLQAGKVELADGLAILNDRAIPFDLAANQLNAEVHYIASNDRYGATIDLADLRTKMQKEPEVQSRLHLTAELGRDMAALQSFDFYTGADSHLAANVLINHFDKPEWQASSNGSLDLKQMGLLTAVAGLSGRLDLSVNGRNCTVTPQVAQQHPGFFKREEEKHEARKQAREERRHPTTPDETMLPPSPECKAGYLLAGNIKGTNVGYNDANVHANGVNVGAQLHVTPTELLFTALTARLPGGGTIGGQMRIENWLGEVPASAPAGSPTTVAAAQTANKAAVGVGAKPPVDSVKLTPVNRAHAYLTVDLSHITLRTIMDITQPANHSDLGLDTSVTGPVNVEWGGPVANIADSVQVEAKLDLAPQGERSNRYRQSVPVSGAIRAHYDGKSQIVKIAQLDVRTPATTLNASGTLGVNNGDPLTDLQVNLQARDLGEFDQTLQTLGLSANGKKGTAALPVVLHGQLAFNGMAKGAVRTLDVKGHLDATNLEVKLPPSTDVQIDSIVADAEYSPKGLAVATSTIKRNTAVLNVTGTFAPQRIESRRHAVSYDWSNPSIDAGVKLANGQIPDLLQIAGQQNIPVTGTVNVNAQVQGTLKNLSGKGNVTLNNGVAYGESYQTVSVDATVLGQQINATRLLLQAHGMAVTGNGSYNLLSKHITAQVQGNNIQLSKLDTFNKANTGVDGVVNLNLTANGTVQEPNLHAKVSAENVVYQGKPLGSLQANADSTASTVTYNLTSQLVGAQLAATGTTSLLGDYQTQARITLANVDVAKVIAEFSPGSVAATSNISATINVSGPAAKPLLLSGNAEFTNFDVTVQGIELKQAGPIRASLHNGVASIDALHITGPDTDLSAHGTATVFGDANPNGGVIDVASTGSVNMTLAHTFDPDLISSGKITFDVGVGGRIRQPELNGNVKFQGVNLAINGIPNGLTDLNGTMVFNENRLTVQNMTAKTGGGVLKVGGSISYQKGIFADLTATGDNVRVRYAGLSATAQMNFRLQGGPQAINLSGNVLITRFSVGPDVDFAAFAGAGGVQAPPDPTAATNKIRLDVRVQSSPQLDFQNSYAKLSGTVDLTVHGTLAVPSILGRINITDGSATFAGTTYNVDRGNIYFANPVRIDPTIDLDVSTRVENYDITVGVHGTTTSLKPTYRSSPPLTEADIFNLLALGRTQEESQLNTQQQVQAGTDPTTSALLGGAFSATVGSRVNKLFGSGSIKVDPAFVGTLGNSTARITVQEPLTKQLTLVFATNVNESAQELIQLQYQLSDDTSVVATRDESGVFSIVYKLRRRYR